jgi:site-specific DNA recombinase
MQGNWTNAAPYYRCRFPSEYALANRVEHPLNATFRQTVLPLIRGPDIRHPDE